MQIRQKEHSLARLHHPHVVQQQKTTQVQWNASEKMDTSLSRSEYSCVDIV